MSAHNQFCADIFKFCTAITPDSSHQNRHAGMVKSWKQCVELLGFHRWKYSKDNHLHCMAFRKTRIDVDYGSCLASHHMLYIPQDSNVHFVLYRALLAYPTLERTFRAV